MLALSAASERNKAPILERLQIEFADCKTVLEIGSGTGQHAVHFARHMPQLRWQPTERPAALAALQAFLDADGAANVLPARALEIGDSSIRQFATQAYDAVFSANTLHIMAWSLAPAFFAQVDVALQREGLLAVYGPFKYAHDFTTPSNAAFDASLRQRDPESGLRDFEAVDALAGAIGLTLAEDHDMPANNQLLIWRRG
jgi:cyclopropane fatty-acyl-phospholipid synthase-like methyltransferase